MQTIVAILVIALQFIISLWIMQMGWGVSIASLPVIVVGFLTNVVLTVIMFAVRD